MAPRSRSGGGWFQTQPLILEKSIRFEVLEFGLHCEILLNHLGSALLSPIGKN